MNLWRCRLSSVTAATVFHALFLAGRTGCSTESSLQLLLQRSENSHETLPAVLRYERGYFRGPDEEIGLKENNVFVGTAGSMVKHKRFAGNRLLLSSVTTAVLAAVACLILLCARAGKAKNGAKSFVRFLAEGGSRSPTEEICGGNPDIAGDKEPPVGGRVDLPPPVAQGVLNVLTRLKTLARTWETSMRTHHLEDIFHWWMRLGRFMNFELGALSALVEGPLEEERQAAAGEVVQLVEGLVEQSTQTETKKDRRRRARDVLKLLRTCGNRDFTVRVLPDTERNAKLEDLVNVQIVAIDLAINIVESLDSVSEGEEGPISQPAARPLDIFGNLVYTRKMQLCRNEVFGDVLERLQLTQPRRRLFSEKDLINFHKSGPAPQPSVQIQELQMVVIKDEKRLHSPAYETPPAGPHHDPRSSDDVPAQDPVSVGTDQGPPTGPQVPLASSRRMIRPVWPAGHHKPTSASATPVHLTHSAGASPTRLRPRLPGPTRPSRHRLPVASLPPPPQDPFLLPSNVTPSGSQSVLPRGPVPPRLLQPPPPFWLPRRFGVPPSRPQFYHPRFPAHVRQTVTHSTASRGLDPTRPLFPPPLQSLTSPGAGAAGARQRSQTHLSPHAAPFFPQKSEKAPGAHRLKGKKFEPFPEGMPLPASPSTSLDASQKSSPEADDPPESAD